MCDQDHFEHDRQEYEARGLVTRKQFGAMVGAGIALLLPRVANAVTVTESEVEVKTPDGTIMAGQPNESHNLFPSNDHPRDLATYTIALTAPVGWTATANGRLVR